ncbi:MAG: hypothetical protein FJX53_03365, partial [Alphaproteobacteria bacterium]|nr:hypothetical protein [Alphaproteobacteria bacterium]
MARQGVPPRLQELVDKLPDCPACIERAQLRIVSVHDRATYEASGRVSGGSTNAIGANVSESVEWSPTSEAIDRRLLRQGRIKASFITLLS